MGTGVAPEVHMLAATRVHSPGMLTFLQAIGVPRWSTNAYSDTERLIEVAGRRCYRAFQDEYTQVSKSNPNLQKVREGNQAYIENILKSGHGSVLEHGHVTFAIERVTRVFTHEMVRHRLCNFSQESLRFVRPTQLDFYFPHIFRNLPEESPSQEFLDAFEEFAWVGQPPMTIREIVKERFRTAIEDLEEVQRLLVMLLGMDDTSKLFADKKKLQSAMRRLMPIGMSTGIIVTSNHRNWRHMIEMRTSRHAEEEIRDVFNQIANQLFQEFPAIYQDAESDIVDGFLEITFKHGAR